MHAKGKGKIPLRGHDKSNWDEKEFGTFLPWIICINILRKQLYFVLYQCFSLEMYFVTVGTFILKGIALLWNETLKKKKQRNERMHIFSVTCAHILMRKNPVNSLPSFIMSILMILSAFQCCTWKLIIAFGNIVVYYCMHHWVGMLYCTHFVELN